MWYIFRNGNPLPHRPLQQVRSILLHGISPGIWSYCIPPVLSKILRLDHRRMSEPISISVRDGLAQSSALLIATAAISRRHRLMALTFRKSNKKYNRLTIRNPESINFLEVRKRGNLSSLMIVIFD